MKILLAVDGSSYSRMSIDLLKALKIPEKNEVTLITVVPDYTFIGKLTLNMLSGTAAKVKQAHEIQAKMADKLLESMKMSLASDEGMVETLVRWGKPAEHIIKEALDIQSDLVVIGAKGTIDSTRFPIGSAAQKVMKYSYNSVLIARESIPTIRRVLLAIDGSKYSDAAVRFLLDLPLPTQSHIFLVTAVESYMASMLRTPTLDLDTNRHILEELQANEEDKARSLLNAAEKQFRQKGYKVSTLVQRGEPADEILKVAETLNPELIVVGAKGLTGIENFLLGSVSQRIARFSRYSVLIVRSQANAPAGNYLN